jgi:dipeptidyl aminopeptidase/acylaminoacyl peptidase
VYAAIALLACKPGIDRSEVPSDPIAFVRVEAKAGITSLEDFTAAITLASEENLEDKRKRKPVRTTIALLSVPTGELRPVPGTSGDLPLDWSPDGLRLLVGKQSARGGLDLSTWNRITGAYDGLTPARSDGWASLADGPVRVAYVGRVFEEGRFSAQAVLLYSQSEGTVSLPDGLGGSDPDISEDGRTILFARPGRGEAQPGTIFVSDMAETQARPLGRGDFPRFSRDGKWIAYVGRGAGNRDVWVMRADGSSKRAVTRSGYDELYPALSPDGRFVVYSSARGNKDQAQLFLARVSDGYEIQLTSNGQNSRPVW